MGKVIDIMDPKTHLGLSDLELDLQDLAEKLLEYDPSKGREKEKQAIRLRLMQITAQESRKEGKVISMSNMKHLYTKVAADTALQEKFSRIMADARESAQNGQTSQAVQETTEKKLLAFAREAGFDVSVEEMQAFFQGLGTPTEGGLSDTELDQVAGGKVQGTQVMASVFTLGIACAVGSIAHALQTNCGDFFTKEIHEDWGSGRP